MRMTVFVVNGQYKDQVRGLEGVFSNFFFIYEKPGYYLPYKMVGFTSKGQVKIYELQPQVCYN